MWTGPVWLIWIGWCSGLGLSDGKKLRNSIPRMQLGRWQTNQLFIALILTCCQNQPFSGSNSLTVIILELARQILPQKRKTNLIFQKFFPPSFKKGSHNRSEIELNVSFIWLVQSEQACQWIHSHWIKLLISANRAPLEFFSPHYCRTWSTVQMHHKITDCLILFACQEWNYSQRAKMEHLFLKWWK